VKDISNVFSWKTLTALDELDYHRKSRPFIFLYETDLLSSLNYVDKIYSWCCESQCLEFDES
jgi:hypothetical protein